MRSTSRWRNSLLKLPCAKPCAPSARSCPTNSLPCIKLYSATRRPASVGSSILSLSCGMIFSKWRIVRLNWLDAVSAETCWLATLSLNEGTCSSDQTARAMRWHKPLAEGKYCGWRWASSWRICSSTSAALARRSAAYNRPCEHNQMLDAPRSHCNMCTTWLNWLTSCPCCASCWSCVFCT